MKNAGNFLDDVKAKHALRSDYQLAKFLGWHQQRITNYRRGGTFDDDAAVEIAEALGVEPSYVSACMSAQRAQSEKARKTWEKVARKVAAGATVALLVACGYALSPDSLLDQAVAAASGDGAVYIMSSAGLLFALIVGAYLTLSRHGSR